MPASSLSALPDASFCKNTPLQVTLGRLRLESGEELPSLDVAYHIWGRLNAQGDNAVLICHALTGSSDAEDWWKPLFGAGQALDPERDFIFCSNVLGSCYGTTGPTSRSPDTGRPWGPTFPRITIRDMVNAQAVLARHLGVKRLRMVIGGSMGGMQALEWAAIYPELVETVVAIATSGRHSAWCIGLSEAQRAALRADVSWRDGHYDPAHPPTAGLAAARMIAMCLYRSHGSFEERFGRSGEAAGLFEVASYLRHQGDKLVERFDANAYVTLTHAMDSHDLGRGRGEYLRVLEGLEQPTLVVSISSDALYPPEEQLELYAHIPRAELAELVAPHGHDAFLIEGEALNQLVVDFRSRHRVSSNLVSPALRRTELSPCLKSF